MNASWKRRCKHLLKCFVRVIQQNLQFTFNIAGILGLMINQTIFTVDHYLIKLCLVVSIPMIFNGTGKTSNQNNQHKYLNQKLKMNNHPNNLKSVKMLKNLLGLSMKICNKWKEIFNKKKYFPHKHKIIKRIST